MQEEFEKKLTMVNFLPVLCNGSIDKSVSEQEIVFVAFADPETRKPSFVFFEVIAPSKSQDFFFKLRFTPCKAEQPLQSMELQEKEAH